MFLTSQSESAITIWAHDLTATQTEALSNMASNDEKTGQNIGTNVTQCERIFDKISNEDIQTLIECYRDNPVLWNGSHPHNRNRETW